MENEMAKYVDRYFEYHDQKSDKFWRIQLNECAQTVWFGKMGSAGQILTKNYGDMKQARTAVSELIQSKLNKGYTEKKIPGKRSICRKFTAHDEYIVDQLQKYITTPEAVDLTDLIIGYWNEASADSPKHITDFLIEHTDKFPSLTSIFIGDMEYEDSEISWIKHHNLEPLLNAFPRLTELRIKGSDGLDLGKLDYSNLEKMGIGKIGDGGGK